MNRLRTSATALLLAAPLTLTACSNGDAEDDVAPGPGNVQVPPVQAPDVDVEDPAESPS